MRKLASFCGVMLGLLLVYNVAPPLVVQGSDTVAGWYPVYEGQPCQNTTTLWCSGGDPGYGILGCTGPSFTGVVQVYPNLYHVHLGAYVGCQSTGKDSGNCSQVRQSSCY